jgi:DNA-binding transcriptional ArsR family regulator
MVALSMGSAALARLRFGISPLGETVRSALVLGEPAGWMMHRPWVAAVRGRLGALDLAVVRALQPPDVYAPDFFHPAPAGPSADIDDELEVMTRTPPSQIRAEVLRTYAGQRLPAVLEPFVSRPAEAVASLADLLHAYWRVALAPHWPSIKAILEGDVLGRARQMADAGAQSVFATIDPSITWADGVLTIQKRCCGMTLPLAGRGLVLTPSVFIWPRVAVVYDDAWHPAVIYPARGIGALWEAKSASAGPAGLGALIGARRATVLMDLDQPRSTSELASRLGMTPGGVSQHLAVLRAAGLVRSQRVGRVVLYARTGTGDIVVCPAPGRAT